MSSKLILTIFVLVCIFGCTTAFPQVEQNNTKVRVARRRIGQRCTDCPQHFCDDDPAIIHGYCCGCARFFDDLPIRCHGSLNCPLDGRGLCRDYEYMMSCCC